MRSKTSIEVISAHAEGEVGDVIIGGVEPPPGDTLWAQSRFIAQDQTLRNFMLNEPRGGVFRHVNLLVPPKNPKADAGFIIMEPEDTPPMSGSNSICVATVLLESGLHPMREPVTELTLEAPGGLVRVRATCRDGKAERITVQNLPSFAHRLDAALELPELGNLCVDTGFGGDSFVIVDAAALGFEIVESEARAREVSEFRQRQQRDAQASAASRDTLEQMFEKIKEGEAESLPVVVKSDVHGSLEAICGSTSVARWPMAFNRGSLYSRSFTPFLLIRSSMAALLSAWNCDSSMTLVFAAA